MSNQVQILQQRIDELWQDINEKRNAALYDKLMPPNKIIWQPLPHEQFFSAEPIARYYPSNGNTMNLNPSDK
jgi:hypothetical protein